MSPPRPDDYFTVATQHPAMKQLLAESQSTGVNGKVLVTKALAAWATAHGSGHLLDRSAQRWGKAMTPLATDKSATLYMQPVVRVAVADVCRRLGITPTQAASCALAWRYGCAAGRYHVALGVPIVIPTWGIPDVAPFEVDIRPDPELRAGQARTRKATSVDAAQAAFVAARESASTLPAVAGLLKPRRFLTAREMADRLRGVPPADGKKDPAQARGPKPDTVATCVFCRARPVSSNKANESHGACATCWTASLDRRIAEGLLPRQSIEARIAWLSEHRGVTSRQAAVWSGLARQAENRRAERRVSPKNRPPTETNACGGATAAQ